jgi:hypothetical protein
MATKWHDTMIKNVSVYENNIFLTQRILYIIMKEEKNGMKIIFIDFIE